MDLITDILSSFFVSSNVVPHRHRNTSIITTGENEKHSNTHVRDVNGVNNVGDANGVSDSSSDLSTSLSSSSITKKETTSVSSSYFSRTDVKSKDDIKDGGSDDDMTDDKNKDECILKKCIIRGRDICMKNMMILNDDRKDNLVILSDILDRISKTSDVSEVYNKKIYIMVSENDMSKYRKMLLENPYLYFTDYDIKRGFSDIRNCYEKRTIYVIDYELLTKVELEKILQRDDIHLMIVGNVYNSELSDMYNKININGKGMLINKKSRMESLQKQFYKNVIKGICNNKFLNFEEYYEKINDENLDVRCVIVDNNVLMYN
jgi:hypothetical protein